MVILLWVRMGDLFGDKWRAKAGGYTDANGGYTQTFLLWCRKLERLTEKQFNNGMLILEERVKRNGQLGQETWPPSYAEFLGFASPSAQHALQSRPVCEVLEESGVLKRALEDKSVLDQRRARGRAQLDAIRKNLGM